ncbi:MAG: SAM-dependent chlorinase/fluorinase [Bacteroidales bacterium]|nr:SAM-dependent chlorinase/fluorinase [Bacteroidales bacterium]
MEKPIVTLTTDWGAQGFFAGMVKGALLRMVEGIQIVDIAHHLPPFNIIASTFVVKHACLGFPEGTVHIIDVASNPTAEHPFVIVKARGQYYICCDNGIPAMAFGDEIEEVVALPMEENKVYNFASYTLFTRVARDLIHGAAITDLGVHHDNLLQRNLVGWVQQGPDMYRIYIHYTDSYGNAYLGMSYREFVELQQGRPFRMMAREQVLSTISTSYYQTTKQPLSQQEEQRRKLQLTVSATGQLELAYCEGSFAQLIGLGVDDSVLLEFR